MKRVFLILVCLQALVASGQQKSYPFYELYQLDSIGRTASISRHFGSLYFEFLSLVEKKLSKADTTAIRLVRHFEQVFARFYIDACEAYERNEAIPHPGWAAYFKDSTLAISQYYLLGANAHLNGQLAEAIYHSYTPDQWKLLKKHYVIFNRCLNIIYRKVYDVTQDESDRARLLHFISLGLDRPAGNYFLYKWRRRQMRLAEYLFDRSDRYAGLAEMIKVHKEKLDHLVIHEVTSAHRRWVRTFRERAPQANAGKRKAGHGDGSYD